MFSNSLPVYYGILLLCVTVAGVSGDYEPQWAVTTSTTQQPWRKTRVSSSESNNASILVFGRSGSGVSSTVSFKNHKSY